MKQVSFYININYYINKSIFVENQNYLPSAGLFLTPLGVTEYYSRQTSSSNIQQKDVIFG